ncbi:hypothetical protein G6F68_015615 [Rhizopus microsporus]|nr:hypothetical protein G6F68_015615 [Rhizopus microsporus]
MATSLTAIANEKQKQAKEATKKGKGKGKPQLVAAGKNSAADDKYNDFDDDYDDFIKTLDDVYCKEKEKLVECELGKLYDKSFKTI